MEEKKNDSLACLIAFLFRVGKEERQPVPWRTNRILESIKKIIFGNEP